MNLINLKLIFRNPVRPNAISQFNVNKVIPFLQRKGYKKSILELELTLGIPSDISLFQSNT